VPNTDCNLFVANALAGDKPAHKSAGIVRRPPPPAIVSIVPATNPTTNKIIINSYVNSIMPLKFYWYNIKNNFYYLVKY
jgi:hypothetical protein